VNEHLPLNSAVEQFGRFEQQVTRTMLSTSLWWFQESVAGNFSPCKLSGPSKYPISNNFFFWNFRAFYNGKKLRMCRGKYSARDLGIHAAKIASIRPVNFTGWLQSAILPWIDGPVTLGELETSYVCNQLLTTKLKVPIRYSQLLFNNDFSSWY